MATDGNRLAEVLDGGSVAGIAATDLLDRFVTRRDAAAFDAMVTRHGPMVLATCRRLLPDGSGADPDDAFQATFLVLARRASSVRGEQLGPWLHGVARRVAARARSVAARRRAVEGGELADVAGPPGGDAAADLRAVLDEELARLPAKFRAPLVLCYLEGLTHDEAADQLGWPVGSVRSRLARGRDRLRGGLTRRGLAPGVALFPPAVPATSAVPPILRAATLRLVFDATARMASPPMAVLIAQGVCRTMTLARIKPTTMALLTAGSLVGISAVGFAAGSDGGDAPPPAAGAVSPPQGSPPPDEIAALRSEIKALTAKVQSLADEVQSLRDDVAGPGGDRGRRVPASSEVKIAIGPSAPPNDFNDRLARLIEQRDFRGVVAQLDRNPAAAAGQERIRFTALCNSGRIEDGLALGRTLSEADKDDAGQLNELAWSVIDPDVVAQPDPRVARLASQILQRALTLNPEDYNILDSLARSQYLLGDFEAAASNEEKALEFLELKAKDNLLLRLNATRLRPLFRANSQRYRAAAGMPPKT